MSPEALSSGVGLGSSGRAGIREGIRSSVTHIKQARGHFLLQDSLSSLGLLQRATLSSDGYLPKMGAWNVGGAGLWLWPLKAPNLTEPGSQGAHPSHLPLCPR